MVFDNWGPSTTNQNNVSEIDWRLNNNYRTILQARTTGLSYGIRDNNNNTIDEWTLKIGTIDNLIGNGTFVNNDFNNYKTPGTFQIRSNNLLNQPEDVQWGILVVFHANGAIVQMIVGSGTNPQFLYWRRWTGSAFAKWYKITGTIMQ